jgi:hypothetical protein
MSEEKIIVYMKHIRQSGMCAGGAREFFEMHSLDWTHFLNNGMPIADVEKIGDVMSNNVAKIARAEYIQQKLIRGQK